MQITCCHGYCNPDAIGPYLRFFREIRVPRAPIDAGHSRRLHHDESSGSRIAPCWCIVGIPARKSSFIGQIPPPNRATLVADAPSR
jgi:hypothetical protein